MKKSSFKCNHFKSVSLILEKILHIESWYKVQVVLYSTAIVGRF